MTSKPLTVSIYTFASVRECFQEDQNFEISFDKSDWSDGNELREYIFHLLYNRWLERQAKKEDSEVIHPAEILDLKAVMVALNEEYLDTDIPVKLENNDRIALIPPVTGG